jgi:hypothetical protein
VSFAWAVAEEASNVMRKLAKNQEVGFFDVSGSDGEVMWPQYFAWMIRIQVQANKMNNLLQVNKCRWR